MSDVVREFLNKLEEDPTQVRFEEVMAVIDEAYEYKPTAFTNGNVENEAASNEGSCKILAFAQLNRLDVEQTLHLFGSFYTKDVLGSPEGNDHQNIRSFMASGWDGVSFESFPLS